MWMLLSTIVLCVFLFSLALLWVRVQDIRTHAALAREGEMIQWEKYKRVTQREAITELSGLIGHVVREEMQGVPVARTYIDTPQTLPETHLLPDDGRQSPEAREMREARERGERLAHAEYQQFMSANRLKEIQMLSGRW